MRPHISRHQHGSGTRQDSSARCMYNLFNHYIRFPSDPACTLNRIPCVWASTEVASFRHRDDGTSRRLTSELHTCTCKPTPQVATQDHQVTYLSAKCLPFCVSRARGSHVRCLERGVCAYQIVTLLRVRICCLHVGGIMSILSIVINSTRIPTLNREE